MATAPVMVSLAEYEALTAAGERLDFADGELIPMANNDSVHDAIKFEFNGTIARQLPEPAMVGNEMAFEVTPTQIRHPDVAVLLGPVPRVFGRKVQGAPDLAIEVVSDSDTAASLDARVELYLDHGATAVWVAWPHSRRVDIHQKGKPTRHIRAGVISGEEPIPSVRVDLARIFGQ